MKTFRADGTLMSGSDSDSNHNHNEDFTRAKTIN